MQIFVGFTSEAIKGGVEALTGEVQIIGAGVKEIRETVIRNAGNEAPLSIICHS